MTKYFADIAKGDKRKMVLGQMTDGIMTVTSPTYFQNMCNFPYVLASTLMY